MKKIDFKKLALLGLSTGAVIAAATAQADLSLDAFNGQNIVARGCGGCEHTPPPPPEGADKSKGEKTDSDKSEDKDSLPEDSTKNKK